jgi:hypothetical protein
MSFKHRIRLLAASAVAVLALAGCDQISQKVSDVKSGTHGASNNIPEPTGANTGALVIVAGDQVEESAEIFGKSFVNLSLKGTSAADVQIVGLEGFQNDRLSNHQIVLNLTGIVSVDRPVSELKSIYSHSGEFKTKQFKPLEQRSIATIRNDKELNILFDLLFKSIRGKSIRLGGFVVYNEPYMRGVTKADLERAIKVLRAAMDRHGLKYTSIGVNFAGAFFNADFAKNADSSLGNYVNGIDEYYARGTKKPETLSDDERAQFPLWLKTIGTARLQSYDQAGNMYTGGGLPEGIDEVSFHYFSSDVLLDDTFSSSLSWFATEMKTPSCKGLEGKSATDIRQALSFFQDGPLKDGQQESDRKLLNQIFSCRMDSSLVLLEKEIKSYGKPVRVSMVIDASSQGVAERDSQRNLEPNQPAKLVESRVYEETKRYLGLFDSRPDVFTGHAYVYLYPNIKDKAGNTLVTGVQGMPDVKYMLKERAQTRK